jgi:AcrR family transcriptional regulator
MYWIQFCIVTTTRRQATRQRLLDAAAQVFADRGFGRTSVEHVCDAAGFTRGAFYSNFTSLDELFLAMWEQQSEQLRGDLAAFVDAEVPAHVASVRDAVEHVLAVVPVDDAWYRITAEFTAHALRTPGLSRVMAAREDAIQTALMPILDRLLARGGRRITDADALGHALVAVHDGTAVQCLIEPDDDAVRRRRTDLFTAVVEHYTEEIPGND